MTTQTQVTKTSQKEQLEYIQTKINKIINSIEDLYIYIYMGEG